MDIRRRHPDLDLACNLLPWLIRHAAWLVARFHTRSKDRMTPYRLVTGSDYGHPLATLGEVKVVLGKLPTTKSKAQGRWVKGLWLGKLDRDVSHILGTSSGAIAVRSVRRLPLESQTDGIMMKATKGIPWQADLDVFAPTPTPESHSLLKVYALQKKWCARSLDIVAAFLIGHDREVLPKESLCM